MNNAKSTISVPNKAISAYSEDTATQCGAIPSKVLTTREMATAVKKTMVNPIDPTTT